MRSDTRDEIESSRFCTLRTESNHTCLSACVTLLSCAFEPLYTPFTAKCSRTVDQAAAVQQDETTRTTMPRRMLPARRFPLTLRASYYNPSCAFRACPLAAGCFIHARMRRYALRLRSEVFSSLPDSLR